MLGVQNTAFECEQLIAHFGENGDKSVALYRQPQPALFAEEWAAIDYCIRQADEYDRVGLEDAAQAAAVLRRLRERLGGSNG